MNYTPSLEEQGPESVRNRQHLSASVTVLKRELRQQNCPQTIDNESLPLLAFLSHCLQCALPVPGNIINVLFTVVQQSRKQTKYLKVSEGLASDDFFIV